MRLTPDQRRQLDEIRLNATTRFLDNNGCIVCERTDAFFRIMDSIERSDRESRATSSGNKNNNDYQPNKHPDLYGK